MTGARSAALTWALNYPTLGAASVLDKSGTLLENLSVEQVQALMADGTILLTGGISHAAPIAISSEAEVYNPRAVAVNEANDVDDPLAPLLKKAGVARVGTAAAQPCTLVQ